MKKIIALLVLVVCLFTLCSCGIAGDIISVTSGVLINKFYRDYEKPLTTVHVGAFSMELPESFYGSSDGSGMAMYASLNSTIVMVGKDDFMYTAYPAGETNEEYARIMRERTLEYVPSDGIEIMTVGDVVSIPGSAYYTIEYRDGLYMYKCLISMHADTDALWSCCFVCTSERFDTYQPYFIEWASSVKLNSVNSEA